MNIKILCLLFASFSGFAGTLPPQLVQQLPLTDKSVMTFASSDFDHNGLSDYVVVLRNNNEAESVNHRERILLVYMQTKPEIYSLQAKNSQVVFTLDDSGIGGDPFDYQNGQGITTKGSYFTVENEVAAGIHWTDFITFKYSPSMKDFIFHLRVYEQWGMNPSTDPDAEILVVTAHKETKADLKKPILLSDYKPL